MEPYRVGPHAGATVKMDELQDELQIIDNIYICNFITFSVGLDSQRHEIPKSKIALTLQHHIVSGKCHSHVIPGLSKSKHYTAIHIQASVLSILCHDRHWPWRNTDRCDTAKHCSTMFIFMYDYPLWWKSIIIIKNKPESSNLHGIVLRLSYPYTSHHGRLESLVITGTYLCWKHIDPHLKRQWF